MAGNCLVVLDGVMQRLTFTLTGLKRPNARNRNDWVPQEQAFWPYPWLKWIP